MEQNFTFAHFVFAVNKSAPSPRAAGHFSSGCAALAGSWAAVLSNVTTVLSWWHWPCKL